MTRGALRVIPLLSTRQPCPHGRKWHHATMALCTGDVSGVTCPDHIMTSLRDHARALRIAARMPH